MVQPGLSDPVALQPWRGGVPGLFTCAVGVQLGAWAFSLLRACTGWGAFRESGISRLSYCGSCVMHTMACMLLATGWLAPPRLSDIGYRWPSAPVRCNVGE